MWSPVAASHVAQLSRLSCWSSSDSACSASLGKVVMDAGRPAPEGRWASPVPCAADGSSTATQQPDCLVPAGRDLSEAMSTDRCSASLETWEFVLQCFFAIF